MRRVTDKKAYFVFSPWIRLFHWIMALCVFVLFATGLYIGDPGFKAITGYNEPTFAVGSLFSMESIRAIHFYAGVILAFSFVFRIYGAFINPGDRLLPHFNDKEFWIGIWETTKHYLFLPEKDPRHKLRNALARLSYFIVYIMFTLEILTGFAMYAQIRPNGLLALVFNPINMYFSEYQVHIIHHYTAWGFMLFIIVHIYMAFRADYMEDNGEVSSMISGIKYYEHDPVDVDDLK